MRCGLTLASAAFPILRRCRKQDEDCCAGRKRSVSFTEWSGLFLAADGACNVPRWIRPDWTLADAVLTMSAAARPENPVRKRCFTAVLPSWKLLSTAKATCSSQRMLDA